MKTISKTYLATFYGFTPEGKHEYRSVTFYVQDGLSYTAQVALAWQHLYKQALPYLNEIALHGLQCIASISEPDVQPCDDPILRELREIKSLLKTR